MPLALILLLAAPSAGDRVLQRLEAADAARVALARESSAWQQAGAAHTVEVAALKAEAQRIAAEAARVEALAAQHTAAPADPRIAEAAALTALVEAAKTRIHAGLTELGRRIDLPPPAADPLDWLAAVEESATRIEVRIATGRIDGAERAVEVLRFGSAGLWWRTLTGDQAGTAVRVDGALVLTPHADAAAISRAIDMVNGEAPPALVWLPVEHLTPR